MTTPSESISPSGAVAAADGGAPVWQPLPIVTEPVVASETVEPAAVAATSVASIAARPRRAGAVAGLLVVGAIVVSAGAGFAVGRSTATGQTGTGGNTAQNFGGGNGTIPGANASGQPFAPGNGNFPGGRDAIVSGTVVSVTSTSITIKLSSGTTVTIPLGSSTTYHDSAATTSSALAAGQTVSVTVSGLGRLDDIGAAASPGTVSGTSAATDVTITAR